MGTPAVFGQGVLQFGRESSWGSAATVTKRMPCSVLDFQGGRGAIRSRSMDSSRVRTAIFAGGVKCRAVIEIEAQYITSTTDPNGILMLHDAIFGTDTYGTFGTTPTGPVSTEYTYEFKNRNLLNSLTLEFQDGKPNNLSQCIQMTGCKVAEAEWRWGWSYEGDENVLRLRITVVGKVSTPATSPTAALAPQAFDPILASHCALTDGISGSTTAYYSVAVRLKNNLLEDGFSSSGVPYIREPVANDFVQVQVELEGDYDTYSHLTAFLNQSSSTGALGFTFSKPSASEVYWIKVISGYAKLVDHKHPMTSPGIIKQTLTWETIKDSNSSAMLVDLLTQDSGSDK